MLRAGRLGRSAAVFLGLVALCGCGEMRASATHAPPFRLGIVANTLDAGSRQGAEQRAARRAGALWLREAFPWREVEPRPGARHWRRLDRLMASATRHGLRVLPVLLEPPTWAAPSPTGLPEHPGAYAAFTRAVVARYAPRGTFWREHPRLDHRLAPRWFELWNEPFLPSGAGGDVRPGRYAAMAAAATAAGKAANPRTRFLLAVDTTYFDADGSQHDWLAALVRARPRLLHTVDGIAVHPYGPVGAAPRGTAFRWRFDRLGMIRSELVRRGGRRLPIWITEMGWSTCSGDPDCVSEGLQTAELSDAFRTVEGAYRGIVRAVFVYHLRDWEPDREGSYGLLRSNGTRKPAWGVYHRVAVRGR